MTKTVCQIYEPSGFILFIRLCFNVPIRFQGMIFLWLRRSTQQLPVNGVKSSNGQLHAVAV